MKRRIYKYPIEITDVQTVSVPNGAIFRYAGLDPQRDPCVWAEVDITAKTTAVKLYVVGTGNPMPEDAKNYLGSFNIGPFMWHIYI